MSIWTRAGFWCEFTVTVAGADAPGKQKTRAVRSVGGALSWLRVDLRPLTGGLDRVEARRAFEWLERHQWTAADQLKRGEPVALSLLHHDAILRWAISPALFLPLMVAPCTCVESGLIS
ncbi:hypothetical protein OIE62_20540 [Streptomyces scopuliridis]|uniref:Uncharacterized protein n=1 Tax=Streptomyces scopuliridis TaxID=452529 RepID=A0ACD4ZPX6_9ACTN|nr:hypothetical protein [Streptomyces scopuliridis]WSB99151.1 hypothetical protein OG835_20410 [Streptomyces scopuliridis]WSC07147.1 hypothetical protein OIE62_20540 [Streptomyces scopuliridis]